MSELRLQVGPPPLRTGADQGGEPSARSLPHLLPHLLLRRCRWPTAERRKVQMGGTTYTLLLGEGLPRDTVYLVPPAFGND